MTIDTTLLDSLTSQAKSSPRLRVACDLRTTPQDNSQRILNAMEPGTVLPIHRHRGSTETVVVLRGRLRQNFYDESGHLEESIIVAPGTDCIGFSVELGRWHNTECLESGTVILECKDGKYEPLGEVDVMMSADIKPTSTGQETDNNRPQPTTSDNEPPTNHPQRTRNG